MKLKRFYGLYFIVGCVFICNPVIKLYDVLPNFIGYLLMVHALKEINVLEYRIENAANQLYYLAGISGVRSLLMFFTFDMDSSSMLSAVSLLAAAEVFFLISFFVSYYGGISYLAQRCESENVLARVDDMRTLGIVFTLVHVAATVLPELAALPELTLAEDPDKLPWLTPEKLYVYKNYATAILFIVSLAVGIWWIKNTASFIRGVQKDHSFREGLESRYAVYIEGVPDEELYLSVLGAMWMYLAGCLCCCNLRLYDDVGMTSFLALPAWVGTVIMAAAAFRMGARGKLILVYGVLGVVQIACSYALPSGIVSDLGGVFVALSSGVAVYLTEKTLADRLLKGIDLDIKGAFNLQRVFLALFLIVGIVYGFISKSWLHSVRVVAFVLWIGFTVRTVLAVKDEIKPRRRF